MSMPGTNLVAAAQAQHAFEDVVRKAMAWTCERHREQGQLLPGWPLGDAVVHGGHAAGEHGRRPAVLALGVLDISGKRARGWWRRACRL